MGGDSPLPNMLGLQVQGKKKKKDKPKKNNKLNKTVVVIKLTLKHGVLFISFGYLNSINGATFFLNFFYSKLVFRSCSAPAINSQVNIAIVCPAKDLDKVTL